MSPSLRDLRGRPIDEEVSSRDVPDIAYQAAEAQSPEREAIRAATAAVLGPRASRPVVDLPDDLASILGQLEASCAVMQEQARVVQVQVAALRARVALDQTQLARVQKIEQLFKED